MKKGNKNHIFFLSLGFIAILFLSCIEEIEPEPIVFDSKLVVEATITDETKRQVIFLSESFNFGDDGPVPVSGATVRVRDGNGVVFSFVEDVPGGYVSEEIFAAQLNLGYTLEVETRDGRSIESQEEKIQAKSVIDRVYAERIVNDDGTDGMSLKVDSFNPDGNARNYRYLYEETYKIIAPLWVSEDLAPDENTDAPCDLKLVERADGERVCYNTDYSRSIIITDTNDLFQDNVEGFEVRFIDSNNYIISHRYSILVRQLVQTDAAYSYFETLDSFASNESLFSETQPGFLLGNLFATDNNSNDILGFFEVASVDEKRIFFDFEEFYSAEPLPPYAINCIEFAPPLANMSGCVLLPAVLRNDVKYVEENGSADEGEGPFLVTARACGDCTALGSSQIPEFWIE